MKPTSEAIRYLVSKGWSLAAIHQAAKDTGMTAIKLADKMKERGDHD